MADDQNDDERSLLYCLAYQRSSVLSIVEGLDEVGWHTSVVPSGWTPAGLVEHLGDAERHWFQEVVAGEGIEVAWDEGRPAYNPNAAFVCEKPSADVLDYYRQMCALSDDVLATTPMSAPLKGRHRGKDDVVPSVRWVVLHIIEETATHSGHLEIARELLDGTTRQGLR